MLSIGGLVCLKCIIVLNQSIVPARTCMRTHFYNLSIPEKASFIFQILTINFRIKSDLMRKSFMNYSYTCKEDAQYLVYASVLSSDMWF